MNKYLSLLLILVAIFVFFAANQSTGFWSRHSLTYSNMTREPYVPPKKIAVRLTIKYPDETSETYDTEADERDTAFNLLRTVAAIEEFNLEVTEIPNSQDIIIEQIRETENVDGSNWNYEINGVPQSVNPNTREIKQGDTVTYIYGN